MFTITNRDGSAISDKEKNIVLFIGSFLIAYILTYFIFLFGIIKGILMTIGYFAFFIMIGWLIGTIRNRLENK